MSQTDRDRCVVIGRRTGDESGKCTVVVLRDSKGYALYPHGDENLCVLLDKDEARTIGAFLIGGTT